MTPLERAKLRIEEDVARRSREQQDRLKGRSALTDYGRAFQDSLQNQPFIFGVDFAAGVDTSAYTQSANAATTNTEACSSSSSESCSSSSSSFD